MQLYTTVPFASLIIFFGLYMGIVQNQNYSRFVRFNGQQAILVDILLILPSLIENLFRPPTSGFGLSVFISLCACHVLCARLHRKADAAHMYAPMRADNTVWLYVVFSFFYAVASCLLGKKVLLPLVGEGADQQVM